MDLQICHKGLACSTLILGELKADVNGGYGPTTFMNHLVEAIEDAKGGYDEDWDQETLQGYSVHQFAFIVASTGQHQLQAEKMLEQYGFVGTERVKKEKNPEIEVRFWVAKVSDFIRLTGLQADI